MVAPSWKCSSPLAAYATGERTDAAEIRVAAERQRDRRAEPGSAPPRGRVRDRQRGQPRTVRQLPAEASKIAIKGGRPPCSRAMSAAWSAPRRPPVARAKLPRRPASAPRSRARPRRGGIAARPARRAAARTRSATQATGPPLARCCGAQRARRRETVVRTVRRRLQCRSPADRQAKLTVIAATTSRGTATIPTDSGAARGPLASALRPMIDSGRTPAPPETGNAG